MIFVHMLPNFRHGIQVDHRKRCSQVSSPYNKVNYSPSQTPARVLLQNEQIHSLPPKKHKLKQDILLV